MSGWDFCNYRDGSAGVFTGWNFYFLAMPPACFFQVFVSAIPNVFFVILFLRKIMRLKTSVDLSSKEDNDREQLINNNVINPLINNQDIKDDSSLAESSSLLLSPIDNSSIPSSTVVKNFKLFLRYCPYVQCSLYFLFIFTFVGDASDFTSGLFVYILSSTIAWILCGVCMDIDLNRNGRFRFTSWPGNLVENFFFVNMVSNCITCVSTETASYENAQSGAVIIVVGGLISTVNCVLYGLCLLQESRFCDFLFQDDNRLSRFSVLSVGAGSMVGVLMRPILKTFSANNLPADDSNTTSVTPYHLEPNNTFDRTAGLLSLPKNPKT
eukprot:gene28922-37944_t